MDWQDYTVAAIFGGLLLLLLRRLRCLLSGRRQDGCAGCGETRCPLKSIKKRK